MSNYTAPTEDEEPAVGVVTTLGHLQSADETPASTTAAPAQPADLAPFLGDLPPPVTRLGPNSFEINHSQPITPLPPDTPLTDLEPRLRSHPLLPLLLESPAPPHLSRHLSTARYLYRRHHFMTGPRKVWADRARPPHIFATDKSPALTRSFRYRSRGASAVQSTLNEAMMTRWTYPFALSSFLTGTDASFTGGTIDHLNQGWSDAFARAVAAPLDFARDGTALLPLAALYEYLGRPLAAAVPTLGFLDAGASTGFSDSLTYRFTAEAKPLGNPRGRPSTAPPGVVAYADKFYRSLSPGLGYAFQQLRQSSLSYRPTEGSGLNGTFAGGQNYRTLRSRKQIHYFLAPSQFMAKNNPRPFSLTNDALMHLHQPLVPGLPYAFFDRRFGEDNDPFTEAARYGGLVQEIREACQNDELSTLTYAWQAYYRMLIGYFYRFGGDFTVIPGVDKMSAEDAATRRNGDEAHGATCVSFHAVDRLVESLRLVSEWLLEISPDTLVPMESEVVAGMRLASPFAHPDDPHYHDGSIGTLTFTPNKLTSTTLYQERAKLVSTYVTRPLRSQTWYEVVRKSIIHRLPTQAEIDASVDVTKVDPYQHAMTHGLAYDPSGADVYRRRRGGVRYNYSADIRGHLMIPGVRIRSLGIHTTQGMAAFLLRYGSNAAVTDGDRVSYGGDLDFGAQWITELAYEAFPQWIGADINFKTTVAFKGMGVKSRGDKLYTRDPKEYMFTVGHEKVYERFHSLNPNFRVPGLCRNAGVVNGRYLVNALPEPVRGVDVTAAIPELEVDQILQLMMLLRARLYSWFEYLNAGVITYNRARMLTKMPTSQYYKHKDGVEYLRQHVRPPHVLIGTTPALVFPFGAKNDPSDLFYPDNAVALSAAKNALDAAKAKADAWEEEASTLHYIRDKKRYGTVKANLSFIRRQTIPLLQEKYDAIPKEPNADAAYELLFGLLFLEEPHNTKGSETPVPQRFSAFDEAKRHEFNRKTGSSLPASWSSIIPTSTDSKLTQSRKLEVIHNAIADMAPIDADLDDETRAAVEKAITDGEYFSPELMAVIGAQHVAFDRSFQALETAEWAAPLRAILADKDSAFRFSAASETRGDSYQFALARVAYYYIADLHNYLHCNAREALVAMFKMAINSGAQAINQSIQTGAVTVPPQFYEHWCRILASSGFEEFNYKHLEDDIAAACDDLRANHRTMYEQFIRQRSFDAARESVAIREQYKRELDATLPPLSVIDTVGNSSNDLLSGAARDYLDGYMLIADRLDVYATLHWIFKTSMPRVYEQWLHIRNATSNTPNPIAGLEEGATIMVERSKHTDQQHQPDVFHYARALNPFIENIGQGRAQTLVDIGRAVDTYLRGNSDTQTELGERGAYADLANRLSSSLASIHVIETDEPFDDYRHCLIATRFGVSLGDNAQKRIDNEAPTLMSNWSTRVDARHTALNTSRERQQRNKLYLVRQGILISPSAFLDHHIPTSVVSKIMDVIIPTLGTVPHEYGWAVANDKLSPHALKMQRRAVIRDMVHDLALYVRGEPALAKIAPHIELPAPGEPPINAYSKPWWHALAALAIERYVRLESNETTKITVGDELVGEAPEMYLARNPGEVRP